MHEIMFALGDLPKIIFKVHFVAGPTLKIKIKKPYQLETILILISRVQIF